MIRSKKAAPFLAAKLLDLDAQLAPTLPRVLATADDEAIHDMRVAMRRTRTLLKLARPVYGRFHADAVRGAFVAVMSATGSLRDEEVLEELFADLGVDDPVFEQWRNRRRARERALRRAVMARLHAGELDRARTMLGALVALPVKPDRDKDVAKLARRCIERARQGVEALRDVPTTDSVGLHNLRIAYKQLRYTAELLADVLPADLSAMARPAAQFQKRLGEIHDADVAIACIARARSLPHETLTRVRAALDALRAKRVRKYTDDLVTPPEASDSEKSPPF
jgi:CHAD domain-containing protein